MSTQQINVSTYVVDMLMSKVEEEEEESQRYIPIRAKLISPSSFRTDF